MRRCGPMKCPIPPNWEVPQVFRDRMGTTLGRQRTMVADGHVLIVLHELPSLDNPTARVAQLFWRSPDGRWRSTVGKGSTANALREHQQTFVEMAERLEERIERASAAADFFAVLQQATPVLRTVRNAHRALQDAREAANTDRELIAARDTAQEIERAFEIVHGYAKDGLEFAAARNAEESAHNTDRVNQSSHRLNMIMALFLPITALGSVFGMNMRHGLEDWNEPYAFWAISAFSFLVGYWIRARLPKPNH